MGAILLAIGLGQFEIFLYSSLLPHGAGLGDNGDGRR
jgi:hypothetical protein